MNHIYKTIFNNKTGEIHVVSEKNSSNCQSQSGSAQCVDRSDLINRTYNILNMAKRLNRQAALTLAVSLAMGSLFSTAAYANESYTGSESLVVSADVEGNFGYLVDDRSLKGVLVNLYDVPTLSNTELTIDYKNGISPDFIIAGYSGLYGSLNNSALVESNTVHLKNGAINGHVYAGLAHITDVRKQVNCSLSNATSDCLPEVDITVDGKELVANKNTVKVSSDSSVHIVGDINAGYAAHKIKVGDLISTEGENDQQNATVHLRIESENNTLTANNNDVDIQGKAHSMQNVIAGYAGISSQVGELKATSSEYPIALVEGSFNVRNATFEAGNNNVKLFGDRHQAQDITAGYVGVNAEIGSLTALSSSKLESILTDNTLSANENGIEVNGEKNTFQNIKAGYAALNLNVGDSSIQEGGPEINLMADNNTIEATSNLINVKGKENKFQDIHVGYAAINLKHGELPGMAFTSTGPNTLSANENILMIGGDHHHLNDVRVGHAGINMEFGDIKIQNSLIINHNMMGNIFNSNSNAVTIVGEKYSINDIVVGYAGSKLKFGEVSGDGITITADQTGTTMSAKNNQIDLTGSSTINGSIYTGYIDFDIEYDSINDLGGAIGEVIVELEGTEAYAIDNSITIEGQHNFSNKDSVIYGGYLAYNKDLGYKPESYDVFTGNTLNYANRTPIHIKEIGNFQTYNFTLSPELGNTDTALIQAETVSLGANSDNISDGTTTASDIYVTGIHSGKAISTDTEFVLMKGDNLEGEGIGHITNDIQQVQQGISLLYEVETIVDKANNQVIAKILAGHDDPGPTINPQLKSLLEGNLAGLMLLTRSADNLAYNTFSAITEQNQKKGLVPFVQMSGHHARYNSGSHIDANGGLLTAGISFQNDSLTLAIFSENGWADYDSHNTFTDFAKVDATGNNRFNGGGIYGQYNFNNGLYADASFRAGRLHTRYKTDDIRNAATGESAHYKVSGDYLSAHAGIGYQFQINSLNRYDLNLKYLWTGTDAQDLMVAGDDIHFDKLNSHRLRLNGENSYQFNPNWSLLLGTGLEYEFDGKAEGTTYHIYSLNAPSVQGLTATGSLGVRYQPVSNKNLTIDFKGQGYLGERDGGGATLHMQYAF